MINRSRYRRGSKWWTLSSVSHRSDCVVTSPGEWAEYLPVCKTACVSHHSQCRNVGAQCFCLWVDYCQTDELSVNTGPLIFPDVVKGELCWHASLPLWWFRLTSSYRWANLPCFCFEFRDPSDYFELVKFFCLQLKRICLLFPQGRFNVK